VHDRRHALHRGVDPLAGVEVAGDEPVAAAAAEHAHVTPGVAQAGDDEPAQGPGSAGDQELSVHAAFLFRCHTGAVRPV
jgi:hypothetical protein